ncbi:hypothetical protein EVG20_g1901 [Dentipellis fragilis]|uniref:Uncharacterized protein n=1 Tax=Dentipellis fragilis TaxID=205917 RepID=A0A4Y9ZB92_9AGAM|nr:hypothetical protein EVG20_g1901 [Dentipellis fragilis]
MDCANLKARWAGTAGGGIEHRLTKVFGDLVDASVKKIKDECWAEIKARDPNVQAREEARSVCERSLDFQSLNHLIVRAILKRHGDFKHHKDLNELLSKPFSEAIMPTWTEFFQTEFFKSLEASVCEAVKELFVEIKEGSGDTLSTTLDKLMSACSRDACSAIISETSSACEQINKEQKALSRSIALDIKSRLKGGYERAIDLDMQGKGSTVKRRELFIQYIDKYSKQVFEGTARMIMTKIFRIVEDAASGLKSNLQSLACDIEVDISNVWEDEHDDVSELRARAEVLNIAEEVSAQIAARALPRGVTFDSHENLLGLPFKRKLGVDRARQAIHQYQDRNAVLYEYVLYDAAAKTILTEGRTLWWRSVLASTTVLGGHTHIFQLTPTRDTLLISSCRGENVDPTARDPASGNPQIRSFTLSSLAHAPVNFTSGVLVADDTRGGEWGLYRQYHTFVNDNPADEDELVDLSPSAKFYGFPDCMTLWSAHADPIGDLQFVGLPRGSQFSLELESSRGDDWCRDSVNNQPPHVIFQSGWRGPGGVDRPRAFMTFHEGFDRSPPTGYAVVRCISGYCSFPKFELKEELPDSHTPRSIIRSTRRSSRPATSQAAPGRVSGLPGIWARWEVICLRERYAKQAEPRVGRHVVLNAGIAAYRGLIFYNSDMPVDMTFDVDAAFADGQLMARNLQMAIEDLQYLNESRRKTWGQKIKKILNEKPPTVKVGLYGMTGSGKSSLINALLDGNFMTTSSYGAGTATITEVAHHKHDKITAEVKLVSENSWRSTISTLLNMTQDATSDDISQLEDERNVAWSQVKCVYPTLSWSQLAEMTVEDILSLDEDVKDFLGATKRITCDDVKSFERNIAVFTSTNKALPKRTPRSMPAEESHRNGDVVDATRGLWPLVEQVKIYCNAPVLSSGVVLVDIPGTSDTNHARSRIAMKSLGQCDKAWILAPISRAISDKIAADLLGESFKRQMQNGYNSKTLSFIATKTDDISCEDVIRQLGLENEEELQRIETQIDVCMDEIESLQEAQEQNRRTIEGVEARLRALAEESDDRIEYPNEVIGAKRLGHRDHNADSEQASKRAKSDNTSMRPMLSEDDTPTRNIEYEVDCSKAELQGLRDLDAEITQVLKAGRTNKTDADMRKRAFCSLARSKGNLNIQDGCRSLKKDFRQGLIDIKYLQLAENRHLTELPVFCTSATDYGKLKGFIKREGDASCFTRMDHTGIPALRTWCHALAAPAREKATGRLFTLLQSLAESVQRYVHSAGEHDDMDVVGLKVKWGEDSTNDQSAVGSRLYKDFEKLVDEVVEDIKADCADTLQDACDEGAASAREQARSTCEEFLDPKTMNARTIDAALRYNGESDTHQELSEALAEPIITALSHPWANFFQSSFFESLKSSAPLIVEKLFFDIQEGAADGMHPLLEKLMKDSLRNVNSSVLSEIRTARREIDGDQKYLSRSIAPYIGESLEDVYERVAELNIRGKGSIMKRRAAFIRYVDKGSEKIFNSAIEMIMTQISHILDDAATEIKSGLDTLADEIDEGISTLWDEVQDDISELKARACALECAEETLKELPKLDVSPFPYLITILSLQRESSIYEADTFAAGIVLRRRSVLKSAVSTTFPARALRSSLTYAAAG